MTQGFCTGIALLLLLRLALTNSHTNIPFLFVTVPPVSPRVSADLTFKSLTKMTLFLGKHYHARVHYYLTSCSSLDYGYQFGLKQTAAIN